MPLIAPENVYTYYICGKCKGKIHFLKKKGRPNVCPECGYSAKIHGTRDVHSVPSIVRLNLNEL